MRVKLSQTIWVMTKAYFSFAPVRLLHETLKRRSIDVFLYDYTNLDDLKKLLRTKENHVVFHLPLDRRLHELEPILKVRGNFSVLYSDWWTDSYDPFIRYADCLIFHHYNIIQAVQTHKTIPATRLPFFSWPQKKNLHEIMLSAARIPYLPCIPIVDLIRFLERRIYNYSKKKLIYMPFAVSQAAFQEIPAEKITYDFVSAGATSFFCATRNCYIPAAFSFVNLYTDRLKLANAIRKTPRLKVFDDRVTPVYGKETLAVMKKSRYAIATGGSHQASILKYLEIIGCGTPIVGYRIPYEFPLINDAVYGIDVFNLSEKEIRERLYDALSQYKMYKQRALKAQEAVFTYYNQNALLDEMQNQYDGKPISKKYLQLS